MHCGIDTQKHNSRSLGAAPEYQIAKVLIFSQQQAAFQPRASDHFSVACGRSDLRHVNNIVSCCAQACNQLGADALIGEPSHGQP